MPPGRRTSWGEGLEMREEEDGEIRQDAEAYRTVEG